MSIASRITSIENHIEEAYTEISRLGVDLTNVDKNIDNIADKLQDVYADLPKVTGEGSSLSLTPTRKGGLTIIPKGACEQDSYSGKNKLNTSNLTELVTSVGVTFTPVYVNNMLQYININGTFSNEASANNYYYVINNAMSFEQNKTYSISGVNGFTSTTLQLYTNSSTAFPSGNRLNVSDGVITRTARANETCEIRLYIYKGNTYNNVKVYPMICVNNTDDTYEPYVGGIPSPNPDYPQDIRVVTGENSIVVSNKNLFNKDNFNYQNGAISSITYDSNGNPTIIPGSSPFIALWIIGSVKELYGKTLTFSLKENFDNHYSASRFINCNLSGSTRINLGDTLGNDNTTLNYTINGTYQEDYIAIRLHGSNVTAGVSYKFDEVMVKYGTTATEYVPHAEQTYTLHLGTEYLAGIGNYKDEIVGKTDDWKIVRNVGKLIVTGGNEENWGKSTALTNTTPYYLTHNLTNFSVNENPLNNYFTFDSSSDDYQHFRWGGSGNSRFYFYSSIMNDLPTFKTWLGTHNLIIYYALATPTEETITDTQIIESLNNMYNLMGYDGTTNITITSNSANAQMEATISALKGE